MLSSDAFEVYICSKCGFIGYQGRCTYCQSDLGHLDVLQGTGTPPPDAADADILSEMQEAKEETDDTMCAVKMPYACKLLL